MITQKFHIIDDTGIKWWLGSEQAEYAQPYCVKDHLRLDRPYHNSSHYFVCDECGEIKIPRATYDQERYAAKKIRAQFISKIDVVNYNGELVPIAKIKSKDDNFSVTAQIMDSKHGKQLVIYAGKKGHKNTQIFVDTEHHKLAFDHKDMDPKEVFAKIEATFKDGSKMSIDAPPEVA